MPLTLQKIEVGLFAKMCEQSINGTHQMPGGIAKRNSGIESEPWCASFLIIKPHLKVRTHNTLLLTTSYLMHSFGHALQTCTIIYWNNMYICEKYMRITLTAGDYLFPLQLFRQIKQVLLIIGARATLHIITPVFRK